MATIFPGSASVGQIFDGYSFNGTAWDIVGIDLTADYLETSTASATYLNKVSASNTYLTQVSASTTYATKTELNNIDLSSASAAAVAAIVDSAPATLDTLNELAAALGDDANYASTITTALGNKLNISTASSTYLTQTSASTIYATQVDLDNIDALPSQSGNSGKYLTTSGSVASWGTLDLSTYLTQASASTIYLTQASASTTYQAKDADLTAIAEGAWTSGLLYKIAPDTWGTITNNSTNWDTAYGWGNHASAGYLTQSSASTTYAQLASPTFTGSVTFGEAITKTTSTVFTSSSATTIATLPVPSGNCIAVECVVLISSTSNGSYYASKVLITADPDYNALADITEYAIMKNNDYNLFPILTATLSGSNVLLRAAVTSPTNATAKVISTSILSPQGAA